MKNLNYVGAIAFGSFIGITYFWDDYSHGNARENKNFRRGTTVIRDDYGLESRYTREDFNQCNYRYALGESSIELGFIDKELIDKDIFMVNCIPVIKYVMDQCDFEDKIWNWNSDLSFRSGCEEQVLDQIIYK